MIKPAPILLLCASLAFALVLPEAARAQGFSSSSWSHSSRQEHRSMEHTTMELRIGSYTPDTGSSAFSQIFGGDSGPMIALEIDAHLFRIPHVGIVGLGLSAGFARYRGRSCTVAGDGSPVCGGSGANGGEKAKLLLLPVSTMAVLRVDALARDFGIPFIFSGKLGLDTIFFRSRTGGRVDGEGKTFGLRWGLQVALELDFLDMRAARALDEDWGINHSFIFFELYGSTANSTMALGDRTFAGGLGMTF
ncbi:MAG: hypothetical protein GXP55_13370 [Deltaproteobacteria bacterium]|nr:hypothetical protein [Deltaproteobacteria bacterium]